MSEAAKINSQTFQDLYLNQEPEEFIDNHYFMINEEEYSRPYREELLSDLGTMSKLQTHAGVNEGVQCDIFSS